MANPIQELYQRADEFPENITQRPDDTAITPSSLGETFGRGLAVGVENIRTDRDYFKGLFNTVTGDSEAAEINIQSAKERSARTGESLAGLETFKEFTDNPTFVGLLEQTAKISGQMAPYALTTIASGGSGAVASMLGKGALTATSRSVAKNLVKDAVERSAKGTGTRSEKDLAELAYRLAHRTLPGKAANKLTASGGALAGQFTEEFSLMAGANFGENLEVEGLSDQEAAYRALALAPFQAAIGVTGERLIQNAIFGNLKTIAKERGAKGSLIAALGKEVAKATGKGAVTEGIAETGQDALQVLNVMQADPTYKSEDALMRLAESAFSGFIGGGSMSGSGRAVTGSLSTAGGIMKKAGEFIETAREQAVDKKFNEEQYGTDADGYTAPEPRSTVNAQIRAALDETTSRHSVWIAGSKPEYDAGVKTTKEVDIEGQTFYTRYVPGRGTILSKNFDIVEAVAKAEASDASLQVALGYSAVKPADADIAIEVLDRSGNVVWQEAANEETVDGAYEAAKKQTPDGGSVRRVTIKEALENRRKLYNEEAGPQVRNMDMDADEVSEDGESSGVDNNAVGAAELAGAKTNNIGNQETYVPRTDGMVYAATESVRKAFAAAFKDVDLPQFGKDSYTDVSFDNPDVTDGALTGSPFASMSDSVLRQATELKVANPDKDITIVENQDGSHSIMETIGPDQEVITDTRFDSKEDLDDGDLILNEQEGGPEVTTREEQTGARKFDGARNRAKTVTEFLRQGIVRAAKSDWATQVLGGKKTKKNPKGWQPKNKKSLVTVNGKAVNLPDLVKEGQRIYSATQRLQFTDGGPKTAMRNGLVEVLSEMIAQGYEIKIGDQVVTSETLSQLAKIQQELNQLDKKIGQEEADVAKAIVEWGLDPDDPNLSGRIDQLNREFADKESSKPVSAIDRLLSERKAWGKQWQAYIKAKAANDKTAVEPQVGQLMALLDTTGGFADGKAVTLSTLLNTTPTESMQSDSQYEVIDDASGAVVASGNKQVIKEFLDANDGAYTVSKVEWDNTAQESTLRELTQEEFDAERNVGFDQMDGISSEPGMDVDPAQEDVGGLSNPGSTVKTRAFGKFPPLVKGIIKAARKTLRLSKAVSIFNANEILAANDSEGASQFNAMFSDLNVAAYVRKIAQELKDNPQGGGRYIAFNNAHIILVDPTSMQNDLETGLVIAHELGHALYNEQLADTLTNPAMYNRLFDAFELARKKDGAPASYQGKRGFEEWYADQTAYWASKEYRKQRLASLTAEEAAGTRSEKAGLNKRKYSNDERKRAEQKNDPYFDMPVKGLAKRSFTKIVSALKAFHDALSKELRGRIGKESYTTEFDGYMAEVLRRNEPNQGLMGSGARAANATYEQKILVRKIAAVMEEQNPGFVSAITRGVTRMVQSDNFTPVYNFLFTADSRLRKIGGNKIADLFYSRSQDSKSRAATKLGFIKQAALEGNAWWGKLEDMIDGDINSDAVKADIDEAFSDAKTADLSGNARAVREWFKRIHTEYIDPSNTDMGFQEDYTPIVLKLSEIHNDPSVLIDLIMKREPNANLALVTKAVADLVAYEQAVKDEKPIKLGANDPAKAAEKSRILTKNLTREELSEAGLLEDSDVALLRYVAHIVKRVEWNRHTKDSAGTSIYEEELSKLSKNQRKEVEQIVQKYLGYNTKPLGKTWRTINSVGSVIQIIAILPLATLGSLPELAGPVIASKDFRSLTVAMKEIVNTVRNREEARALARDIGVVTSQSVANAMMSQSELEWMGDSARKLTDGFFRITLLDTYTKFTREFASNMGLRFLETHANPDTAKADSARYLKELGVTAEEVNIWEKSDQSFDTPEGQKVRRALQRFVESSTLRPNAAERPLWASDPRWALAWQLKGFFYSYGKVMLAGAKRESAARIEGVSGKDAGVYGAMAGSAGIFALMGIATMPLAMVGMELREYAKFGLAWGIPGIDHESKNYFRTDDLSWSQYLHAAFSRSFAAGPVTIASQMFQAADWGKGVDGAFAVAAGPTAETFHRAFTEGFGSTFRNRVLPTGIL